MPSVVEVPLEVVEAVVVVHVVDMMVEVVEVVLVAHQFEIETVPLLVGFLLEKLLTDPQQLCYPL